MKKELNIYNLSGVDVSDEKVLDLYGYDRDLANSPEFNFQILEEARQQELEEYPEDEELINMKYDRQIMKLKVKLANRGLLHGKK